jgi:hypothetical protein
VLWDLTSCGSCKKDVSEERSTSIISVKRIGELGTTLAVTKNRHTLTDFCYPDQGGSTFLRIVGSYKSHMA